VGAGRDNAPMPSCLRLCAVALIALLLAATAASAQQNGRWAPAAPDPAGSPSYLVYAPTAAALPAGHGYFQVGQFLFPRFQVGLTDRVSVGAATFALYPHAVLLTPKVQIVRGARTSVAVGVMHLAGVSDFNTGLAYVVSTTELQKVSVTAGVGLGYVNGRDSGDVRHRGHQVTAQLGVEFHGSARDAAVVEGHNFGTSVAVLFVKRHMWTGLSLDLGVMAVISSDAPLGPAPVVNLAWRF
jgi:hypothetical protein